MKLAVLFRFVLFATLLGLAANVWMNQRADNLQASQAQLLDNRLEAIEQLRLLQSEFDALQTLVAAYVVSKNSQHLVNYYELLDAHAGARQYASPVDSGYWSNLIAGTAKPIALVPTKGDTLAKRLAVPQELAPQPKFDTEESVSNILDLSKALREREQVIFALTQGLYDPVGQQYVSEAPVREDLAIEMLFSEEYLSISNAIRAEIQLRIDGLEKGFQQVISEQTRVINENVRFDFYLGLAITLLLLLGLLVFQRYVISPLRELNNISKQIASGNYNVVIPKPGVVAEIANLIRGFALMIGSFRRELDQIEITRAAEVNALEAKIGRERAEAQAQARGMLLANMSHEIRTPMNAILGMTALTLKSDLPPQERGYLLKVQDAARSLLGLLNDILDFSKAEAGMVELESIEFTLDEVLANSFLAVQNQAASRKLMLINEVANGYSCQMSQRLIGDPSRLRQVISNLLSNAVKFTETGSIRVYSKLTSVSNEALELRVEVHDTGSGLTKSQMERIFGKFAQANASVSRLYGGTGLGLSIARELVHLMGGEISVQSTPGKGSCFWFRVPLRYDSDILATPQPMANQAALVLHERGSAAQGLASVLRSIGLNVQLHHRADSLLEAFKAQPCDWLFVQSGFPLGPAGLPGELLEKLLLVSTPVVLVDQDLFSSENTLFENMPAAFHARLQRVAHPILTQDIHNPVRTHIEPPQQGGNLATATIKAPFTGMRALVLEDHPVNQELIEKMLTELGFVVHVHANGHEAVTWLDDDRTPDLAVIITDLEMPIMDGYEFVHWLKDQTRWMDTPVIGLTGHAFIETKNRCLDLGMADFITKPIEAQVLQDSLSRVLGVQNTTAPPAKQALQAPNRALFMTHCANLPEKLTEHLAAGQFEDFQREIHSMVSLLALMGEPDWSARFRAYEQGLAQGRMQATTVLEQITTQWPSLTQRFMAQRTGQNANS